MSHPLARDFTAAEIELLKSPASHVDLAREFGCSDWPIRKMRTAMGWKRSRKAAVPRTAEQPHSRNTAPLGPAGTAKKDGVTTVTSPPLDAAIGDAEGYLRKRWGFPADKWLCMSAIGNEWQGGDGEGGTKTYTQVKGSFRPVNDIVSLVPRPGALPAALPRMTAIGQSHPADGEWHCIVAGDPQIPYHDVALHQATLAMIEDVSPRKFVHIGDLCDYTNVSKHKDHEYVNAAVDECTQGGVDMLVDFRRVHGGEFVIVPGNHDIRPLSELLLRAERMAGIRAGKLPGEAERKKLISLRTLWRLDELGIDLCSDPRGWEHAEYEIVPGQHGLVAIHGNLTGENVAKRTVAKVGRSVIMGHTHGPEHAFVLNRTTGREMQGMVVGCQCEVRGGGGKKFPTFAARDGWLQGPALVTVFPGGEFTMERARWNGKHLYCGMDRWSA